MATKIKLRIERPVFESIFRVLCFVSTYIVVEDWLTLFFAENLKKLHRNFENKKYTDRDRITITMDLGAAITFIGVVGNSMKGQGDYERAVYDILEFEVLKQVDRAIQSRKQNH